MKKRLLKFKKALLGLSFLVATGIAANGQETKWVKQIGGTGSIGSAANGNGGTYMGKRIVADLDGNVFAAVNIPNNSGFSVPVSHSATNGMDIFLSKHDKNGTLLWSKVIGGTGDATSHDWVAALTVDTIGNVYATGSFSGTIDFNPGDSIVNRTSKGGKDAFVVKYASNGDFQWVQTFGDTAASATSTENEGGTGIGVNTLGEVIVTGIFTGTLSFEDTSIAATLTSLGDYDVFLLKLTKDGGFQWVKQIGGTGADRSYGLVVDSENNAVITGSFIGTTSFNLPTLTPNDLTSTGTGIDAWVAKFSPAGVLSWVKQIKSTTSTSGHDIAVDSGNNIFVTGTASGEIDFGSPTLLTTSGSDHFIVKLSKDGNYTWAKVYGSSAGDQGYGVAIDASGDVYTCGYFATGTATVDLGNDVKYIRYGEGEDGVILKSSGTSGLSLWVRQLAGPGTERVNSITANGNNIYVAGIFGGRNAQVNFGNNNTAPSLTNLTAATTGTGGWDTFILNIENTPTTTPVTFGSFTGVKVNGGNQLTWTTFSEINNSHFELERSIDGVNFHIIKRIEGAGNSTSKRSYNYIDNQPLSGVNYYRLKQIDNNGEFSYAEPIIALNNEFTKKSIVIYPVPTTGELTISGSAQFKNAVIKITNLAGQIVYVNKNVNGNNFTFNIADQASGIYTIEIVEEEGVERLQIIKN